MASVVEYFYDGGQLLPEDFAVASKNGISYMNAYNRFYVYGWTKHDAITKPLKKPNLWPKYGPICKENGVSETSFYHRIKHGMSPEEAATKPKLKRGEIIGKPQQVKITPEIIAIAEKNGISKNTLKYRVSMYKWSVERAMTEPVHKQYRRKDLEANRVRS